MRRASSAHPARSGFTLAEAIAAMVILTLIIGAIFAFQVSAVRLSSRVSRTYVTQTRAADAVRTLAREMKEGIAVTTAQSTVVEYAYPAKVPGTEDFRVPLQVGYNVRYYLGNKSGTAQSGGTYLWRADSSTGTMRPVKMLTDKVQSFTLTYRYPAGSTSADAVSVQVGVTVTTVCTFGRGVSVGVMPDWFKGNRIQAVRDAINKNSFVTL